MKKYFFAVGLLVSVMGYAQAQDVNASADSVKAEIASLQERTEQLESTVNKMGKLKITGYIQAQMEMGQKDASLKVGGPNENKDDWFTRFGIRRGRLKFVYSNFGGNIVFQLDVTEKGVGFKDAYLDYTLPKKLNFVTLKAGVFDRPFGDEIKYSSSRREMPERSLVFQTLFPEERDLGAEIKLQAPKGHMLNFLKLEAALVAGNGIKMETDNRKDLIMHLHGSKKYDNWSWGLGTSFYNGGVYQSTDTVYKMEGDKFVANIAEGNKGKNAKRQYFGFDGQVSFDNPLGFTQFRAEYVWGTQPGSSSSSKSPNYSNLPGSSKGDAAFNTYIRPFRGGYLTYVQNIGKSKFDFVGKYNFYDPNTKVKGDEVGAEGSNTNKTDLATQIVELGLLYRVNTNISVMANYAFYMNETSANVKGYEKQRKDDTFTLRAQYKF
ncbi:MAG: hypothetical protein ACRC13_07900 [Tannerellaceae bacterium]